MKNIDLKSLFKSHCNCNLNSMLLGYNSIAIKEQKQWDCGGRRIIIRRSKVVGRVH